MEEQRYETAGQIHIHNWRKQLGTGQKQVAAEQDQLEVEAAHRLSVRQKEVELQAHCTGSCASWLTAPAALIAADRMSPAASKMNLNEPKGASRKGKAATREQILRALQKEGDGWMRVCICWRNL